jgi:hypothetical protein
MTKTKSNRITPEIAGQYLGMSAALVKSAMKYGKLKIGTVFITTAGKPEYIITPKSFYDGTGIKINGYEPSVMNIDYEYLVEAVSQKILPIKQRR